MKYCVTLHHYVSGNGYSYSEQFDEGTTDKPFSAQEYVNNAGLETDTEDGWTEVEIKFFASDDADPAFDDPVDTSIYNETMTGKF